MADCRECGAEFIPGIPDNHLTTCSQSTEHTDSAVRALITEIRACSAALRDMSDQLRAYMHAGMPGDPPPYEPHHANARRCDEPPRYRYSGTRV